MRARSRSMSKRTISSTPRARALSLTPKMTRGVRTPPPPMQATLAIELLQARLQLLARGQRAQRSGRARRQSPNDTSSAKTLVIFFGVQQSVDEACIKRITRSGRIDG